MAAVNCPCPPAHLSCRRFRGRINGRLGSESPAVGAEEDGRARPSGQIHVGRRYRVHSPRGKVEQLYRELDRGFDMVFSVGTTSVFPYITEPVLQARRQGWPTVEINPGSSEVSHLVDHRIQAGAAETLFALLSGLESD